MKGLDDSALWLIAKSLAVIYVTGVGLALSFATFQHITNHG